ncbi:MAG: TVP38/TMEM64 family protein [Solirubrobacteraceae bacterium]|nr:TVP38/TMEM64 family protein [Solirubrobacteraceae bacterium]
MAGARARLATLVVGLAVLWLVFGPVGGVLEKDDVRGVVDAAGPLAPLAFVPISGLLALVLVPGPLLAATAGALFGTWVGFAATLASALTTSALALLIGRHAGRDGAREFGGRRVVALEAWLDRQGVATIITARLVPGLSDAAVAYAAGAVSVSLWQILLGTAIGAAPRALAYAALGDSITDLTSPQGIAAAALLIATAVLGAELLRRTVRSSKAAARAVAEQESG